MAQNQFEVFGVDVRDYGRLILAAWRDFLHGDDSPVKRVFDSTVAIKQPDGALVHLQGGVEVPESVGATPVVALPAELVLERQLQLPGSIETDLEGALLMEVSASSPFSPEDTAAGWHVVRTEDGGMLSVNLALASKRAVAEFLSETHRVYDVTSAEVWAKSDDVWVALRGFGEAARQVEYRSRLLIAGAMLVGMFVLVLLLAGLSAVLSQSTLAALEARQAEVSVTASEAMKLRDRLSKVNATVDELNKLSRQLPSPQLELARLTELLPDSAYVVQYTQNGQKIRLRGRSTDAASLQQALTEVPVFRSVTAPQAISRVGDSNIEQFFLDLELKGDR